MCVCVCVCVCNFFYRNVLFFNTIGFQRISTSDSPTFKIKLLMPLKFDHDFKNRYSQKFDFGPSSQFNPVFDQFWMILPD